MGGWFSNWFLFSRVKTWCESRKNEKFLVLKEPSDSESTTHRVLFFHDATDVSRINVTDSGFWGKI